MMASSYFKDNASNETGSEMGVAVTQDRKWILDAWVLDNEGWGLFVCRCGSGVMSTGKRKCMMQ